MFFVLSAAGADISYASSLSGKNACIIENPTDIIAFNAPRVSVSGAEIFADGPYTVINIRNLHCHARVRQNIGRIIAHLHKNYDIAAVFAESGYGQISAGGFYGIKDGKLRDAIIESLSHGKRLTRAEYYYLKND